jgi:hypothetical protein
MTIFLPDSRIRIRILKTEKAGGLPFKNAKKTLFLA